jgi:hypothetical protein
MWSLTEGTRVSVEYTARDRSPRRCRTALQLIYHFMFRNDAKVIKREDLRRHMKRLSTVFRLGMKFYAASSKSKSGYREIVIKP